MSSAAKSAHNVIEANLSDLMKSPTRLESSYEMRDLRIESLSLSEEAERRAHSSVILSMKLRIDSSPAPMTFGREEGYLKIMWVDNSAMVCGGREILPEHKSMKE